MKKTTAENNMKNYPACKELRMALLYNMGWPTHLLQSNIRSLFIIGNIKISITKSPVLIC